MKLWNRALCVAEAGPEHGLGHVQRSLALAAALKDVGIASVFLLEEDPFLRRRVEAAGAELEPERAAAGEEGERLAQIVAAADRRRCGLILVDSYRLRAQAMSALRSAGHVVAAIDDLAHEPFPCHVVVNGGAQAPHLPYRSTTGDTAFLLGPHYALLRPELWAVPPRDVNPTVRQVLVSVGGADPHGLLPELVALLDAMPGTFDVAVIAGPYVPPTSRSRLARGPWRHPLRVVEAPESVRELFLSSDVAISGAGQTLYELAATGTPAIAIEVADNQAGSLAALEAAGVVRSAGRGDAEGWQARVRRHLEALMSEPSSRAALSSAGQRLVDGAGAARVARAVAQKRNDTTPDRSFDAIVG